MSLDNILQRNPAVALVDELAHTNVPGSRNKKRYQDVLELLAAGINVIGAFNVQHLESLNDVVERATGVAVRETIPDSFLKQADQVVNLDLAVEDLQERLRGGQDLRRRPRSPGRSSTSSPSATWPTCASWPCARWPRAWSGPASTRARRRAAPASAPCGRAATG